MRDTAVFRSWLPLAFVASLLCLLFYGCLQQYIRSEANNPQVQLAQDAAATLSAGSSFTVSNQTVDISTSLAPFTVRYDSNGQPIDGTGKLNGSLPSLPAGVFSYTRAHTEDRLTWQPQANTRIAAVVRYYQHNNQSGFILAGRNLKEVETQENHLLLITMVGWAITTCGSLLITIAFQPTARRKP